MTCPSSVTAKTTAYGRLSIRKNPSIWRPPGSSTLSVKTRNHGKQSSSSVLLSRVHRLCWFVMYRPKVRTNTVGECVRHHPDASLRNRRVRADDDPFKEDRVIACCRTLPEAAGLVRH